MKMKAVLSNGACAAVQSANEFYTYYNRKIAEGKPYIKSPTEYLKQAS